MASNLISDALKLATPASVEQIGASQGVSADVARSVLASAVSAIFASIAQQAATSRGLDNILANLHQAANDAKAKLPSAPDGGASSASVVDGADVLRRMIGDGAFNDIVIAIGKTSGVSAEAGAGLVTAAGQMAVSVLAKRSVDLDADELLALLGSQMNVFRSSLPAPLASSLGVANTTAPPPARPIAPAHGTEQLAAAKATLELTDEAGSSSWLMWLVPVIIVAAGMWYYIGHRQAAMVTEPPPAQISTTPPATTQPAVIIDNVDISKALTSSMLALSDALKGVSDAASAQSALAKLKEITSGISQVSGFAGRFTLEQRTAVAALVRPGLPQLKDLALKVEGLPGVGDILRPVIDPATAQLEALAKG